MKKRSFDSFSDEQLVSLIMKDDYPAFTELYKRSWSHLYIRAFNILHDPETCKDLCQEVFVWLWENRKQIHIKSSVRGYLYTAVKYKTANYIRNGKVRDIFFEKLKNAPEEYSIEVSIELKELKSFIQEFTNKLPERCSEVFKLSRQHYLSNKEIATRLNISERTVENQISIALKKLRKSLGNLSSWFFFL